MSDQHTPTLEGRKMRTGRYVLWAWNQHDLPLLHRLALVSLTTFLKHLAFDHSEALEIVRASCRVDEQRAEFILSDLRNRKLIIFEAHVGYIIEPYKYDAYRHLGTYDKNHCTDTFRKRWQLAIRDGGTWQCHYCGNPLAAELSDHYYTTEVFSNEYGEEETVWIIREGYSAPEIEHKMPRSRGGSDDASNLVLSCRTCNSLKRTKTEEEFFDWLELQGGVINE